MKGDVTMKEGIKGFVIGCIVTAMVGTGAAWAASNLVTIEVAPNNVNFEINGVAMDIPSFTYNDSTYVQLRPVLENMDCSVGYNAATKTVIAQNDLSALADVLSKPTPAPTPTAAPETGQENETDATYYSSVPLRKYDDFTKGGASKARSGFVYKNSGVDAYFSVLEDDGWTITYTNKSKNDAIITNDEYKARILLGGNYLVVVTDEKYIDTSRNTILGEAQTLMLKLQDLQDDSSSSSTSSSSHSSNNTSSSSSNTNTGNMSMTQIAKTALENGATSDVLNAVALWGYGSSFQALDDITKKHVSTVVSDAIKSIKPEAEAAEAIMREILNKNNASAYGANGSVTAQALAAYDIAMQKAYDLFINYLSKNL